MIQMAGPAESGESSLAHRERSVYLKGQQDALVTVEELLLGDDR